MDLLTLCEQDVRLQRVSNHRGGEHAGPCPSCDGDDRFHVWPAEGRYWCRGCGKHGDTIQYLRDFRGLSFREAARLVGKQLGPYRPQPAADTLWRYLEEQYETLREELTIVQWASLAIPKHPEWYSYEERMDWAVRAVQAVELYAQLEALWRKVEDGTRTDHACAA